MKKKVWLIVSIVLIIALGVIIFSASRILSGVFEKSTRILEWKMLKEAPPEYSPRIRRDFDSFILAFKEKKIKKEGYTKLSELLKAANEDKKFDLNEIEGILECIEEVTSGLK